MSDAKEFPRFRVTVELIEPGPASRGDNSRLAIYSLDRAQIAGDVWLNSFTRSHSVEINAGEFVVGVGSYMARSIRDGADIVNYEREGRSRR